MGKVRLLLRSIYLKGHMDANKKTSDMSWEDEIVVALLKLVDEEVKGLGKRALKQTRKLGNLDMSYMDALADVRDRMNVLFQ